MSIWTIKGMKLTGSNDWNDCLDVKYGSTVYFSNVDFGAAKFIQVYVKNANVICNGNYTISGNAQYHWYVEKGDVFVDAITVTLSGTEAYSAKFIMCTYVGVFVQS